MKALLIAAFRLTAFGWRGSLPVVLLLALPACQDPRIARLEAVQQRQARELAELRQRLEEKEEEVAQLETCVDDLEHSVYEDEGEAPDEEADGPPATTQL